MAITIMIDGESIATASEREIEFETKAGQRLEASIFVTAAVDGAAVDGTHAPD